jgi:hypothetical protein
MGEWRTPYSKCVSIEYGLVRPNGGDALRGVLLPHHQTLL